MAAHLKLPPLLTYDQAIDAGMDIDGRCDWGCGEERETWGMRWWKEGKCYLPVCQACSKSSWPDGGRRRA